MSGSHVIPSQCLSCCLHGRSPFSLPPAVVLLRLTTAKATPLACGANAPLDRATTATSAIADHLPCNTASKTAAWQTDRHGHWCLVPPENLADVLAVLATEQNQRCSRRDDDRLRRLERDERLRKDAMAAAEERRRRLTQTTLRTFFPAPRGEN